MVPSEPLPGPHAVGGPPPSMALLLHGEVPPKRGDVVEPLPGERAQPPGERTLGGGPGDGGALTRMASVLTQRGLTDMLWLSMPGVLTSLAFESSGAEAIIPKPGQ
mmetsp:Transcript_117159/g.207357  ORF Transcript_117159/g.207357 Transcript_117159/m.207357 type:complete len:106 (+) Transcript_117159:1121-1438(+)